MQRRASLWYTENMKNVGSKSKVQNLARLLCGDRPVEVRGTRIRGKGGDEFLSEVAVDGRVVARARHRNWKMSYKILTVELSKAFIA